MSQIASNFDTNADGWTIAGDPKSDGWISSDGDPGGYFGWANSGNTELSYYTAPAKFLGNDKAYYGGTLTCDVVAHANGDEPYKQGYADLVLYDGKHELVALDRAGVGSTWTGEVYSLKAGDLYDVDANGNATLASKSEIKTVLAHLEYIGIRAEYYGDNETGGIDNVVLQSRGRSAAAPAEETTRNTAHGSDGAHLANVMHFAPHLLLE